MNFAGLLDRLPPAWRHYIIAFVSAQVVLLLPGIPAKINVWLVHVHAPTAVVGAVMAIIPVLFNAIGPWCKQYGWFQGVNPAPVMPYDTAVQDAASVPEQVALPSVDAVPADPAAPPAGTQPPADVVTPAPTA